MGSEVLTARAFAKINLDLRILGTLPGGYHALRTTFQSIALCDLLTFTPTADGRLILTCDDPNCPTDRTNLVWKAADLVRRAAPERMRRKGVRVSIEKRIPMQAGLGGGSSDAAAALRACARLWGVKSADLQALASSIGADVAYFLRGGTARGTGRGEVVRRLRDRSSAWVVLVLPDFGISTKDAYGWFDQMQAAAARPRSTAHAKAGGRRAGAARTINDLEAPVIARYPQVGRIVDSLRRAGAFQAAMTGSGSAVFGLFKTRRSAEAAANRLNGAAERVVLTRTLGRDEYRAFSRPGHLPPADSLV